MRFSSQMSLSTRCNTIEPALWVVKAIMLRSGSRHLLRKIMRQPVTCPKFVFSRRFVHCFEMLRPILALLLAGVAWPGAMLGAAPNDSAIASLYARGLAGDKQSVIDCI